MRSATKSGAAEPVRSQRSVRIGGVSAPVGAHRADRIVPPPGGERGWGSPVRTCQPPFRAGRVCHTAVVGTRLLQVPSRARMAILANYGVLLDARRCRQRMRASPRPGACWGRPAHHGLLGVARGSGSTIEGAWALRRPVPFDGGARVMLQGPSKGQTLILSGPEPCTSALPPLDPGRGCRRPDKSAVGSTGVGPVVSQHLSCRLSDWIVASSASHPAPGPETG